DEPPQAPSPSAREAARASAVAVVRARWCVMVKSWWSWWLLSWRGMSGVAGSGVGGRRRGGGAAAGVQAGDQARAAEEDAQAAEQERDGAVAVLVRGLGCGLVPVAYARRGFAGRGLAAGGRDEREDGRGVLRLGLSLDGLLDPADDFAAVV